jgi:hypothetical protein
MRRATWTVRLGPGRTIVTEASQYAPPQTECIILTHQRCQEGPNLATTRRSKIRFVGLRQRHDVIIEKVYIVLGANTFL